MPEPVILNGSDSSWPDEDEYWSRQEWHRPTFGTQTVAEVFFGRSNHWLNLNISRGNHGGLIVPRRNKTNPNSPRAYRLWDIEQLAYAFARNRVLDGQRLARARKIVRLVAAQHGYIE